MATLLQKLQVRTPEPLVVACAPPELEPVFAELGKSHGIERRLAPGPARDFVLVFVQSCKEIEKSAKAAVKRVTPDGLLWFAYPKKSSKRYSSDIGRDDSWSALGALGFEGVRMVAVDEDWSALRFRRAENIKSMKRDPKRALSAAGKARAKKTAAKPKRAAKKR